MNKSFLLLESNGISLLSVLGYDKDAHFCAGMFIDHLNDDNHIVINKRANRTHWKLATTKKELQKICGLSNNAWSKAIKLLEEKRIIFRTEVDGQKVWAFNPHYA